MLRAIFVPPHIEGLRSVRGVHRRCERAIFIRTKDVLDYAIECMAV